MKRMLLLCGALLLAAIPAAAQHSAADFVGTWELVSIEERSETGDWEPWESPWPGKPVGILMYDNLGNIAVQITCGGGPGPRVGTAVVYDPGGAPGQGRQPHRGGDLAEAASAVAAVEVIRRTLRSLSMVSDPQVEVAVQVSVSGS